MPRDLLLEVGTEEIPAAPLDGALAWFRAQIATVLDDQRIGHGAVSVLGTPRRMAILVADVQDCQRDLSEVVAGPPARIAFDDSGAPTKAAQGFARKNGVELAALRRGEVEGKKGEYVLCTREQSGQPTIEILPAMFSQLLAALPWPKSMRWSDGQGVAFVRPVQWIAALLGDEIVEFEFAGERSAAMSRGHRFLSPDPFRVGSSREAYTSALRERQVIVCPEARRTMIEAELRRLEREHGATVRSDERLVAEVANLVEYPVGLVGNFDASFLEVPEAVIVSAMRGHQRYFAMEHDDGVLANKFAAIAGTITRDREVVSRGNERVLAARLADAKFFFDEDRKSSLDELAKRLEQVVFQKKLGSIGAKVERVASLASSLATELGENAEHAERAARLAKADLVSHVVGEFPDLQGTMGRVYATYAGEPAEVAVAIEEHYLPRGAGDSLPKTATGALVGIADRVDTVVGCFAAGLAPTGSADPYGLRRAALGILTILLDRNWSISIVSLIELAARGLGGAIEVTETVEKDVAEFFRVRFKGLLSELPTDCVEAALAAGYANVPDARARATAVAKLRGRTDFEPLAVAFKRVANILKGAASPSEPDEASFVEDDERALWSSFSDIRSRAESHLEGGDYNSALTILAELKAPVDKFFDAVLVMDENTDVRNNRLALLGQINATFTRIADFRQLAVQGG